jgi:hypothetical protein
MTEVGSVEYNAFFFAGIKGHRHYRLITVFL